MQRFPLICTVSVFSTQSPLRPSSPIPASPAAQRQLCCAILQHPTAPQGTEAGGYHCNHIKVGQDDQGSGRGTAVKQLEAPKGLGQTRCSAPGEHPGLSRAEDVSWPGKRKGSRGLARPAGIAHTCGVKVSGDLCVREHLDILHTIYHTYRSSFGYGNDDSHCSRNSCWFPSRAGSGGSWPDKSAQFHQMFRIHCLLLKALHHLAGCLCPGVCSAKPTAHLRMLPPGSHCCSGCLPWLVLRKYQKPLEGLSTCPGWGSTGATGIKRHN